MCAIAFGPSSCPRLHVAIVNGKRESVTRPARGRAREVAKTRGGAAVDDVAAERDGEGDLVTVYRVRVTAWLSDELTLHRHLDGGKSDHGGPDETWIGRRIRVRHNTLDPEDLYDVRFDGWPDREAKGW